MKANTTGDNQNGMLNIPKTHIICMKPGKWRGVFFEFALMTIIENCINS